MAKINASVTSCTFSAVSRSVTTISHRERGHNTERCSGEPSATEGRREAVSEELDRQHTSRRVCARGRCIVGVYIDPKREAGEGVAGEVIH